MRYGNSITSDVSQVPQLLSQNVVYDDHRVRVQGAITSQELYVYGVPLRRSTFPRYVTCIRYNELRQ